MKISELHGLTGSSEYNTWRGMKDRCYNPSCTNYKYYGGRGIKICDRWKDNFVAFLRDMGHKPSPRSELDRINNKGDYTPSNCRWSSHRKNMNNTRNNK